MLKTDPKYGVFPWWPENGNHWLHPQDVLIARNLIPSSRVFRRDDADGDYVVYSYGSERIRGKRTLWLEVAHEGLDLGMWVEILPKGMQNDPRTGTIGDMLYQPSWNQLRYRVIVNELPVPKLFAADDLRPVEPTQPNTWSREIRREE